MIEGGFYGEKTLDFAAEYARSAGVEGTITQAVRSRVARHTPPLRPAQDALGSECTRPSFIAFDTGAARADAPRERIEFLLSFLEATGLGASELVQARLGDLRQVNRGWMLQVLGKGGKARLVVVPTQAAQGLDQFLQRRGIARPVEVDRLDTDLASLPLVSSTLDACAPVSYSALYRSTQTWFDKAIWASDLTIQDKLDASRASLYWLRHTCGTRALDRGVSIETVQCQLGHADARTTMRYAKPQLERVRAEMEKGFG